jgi:hypothetical protein
MMCFGFLPPPDIPYLRHNYMLYGALALALLCLLLGWVLLAARHSSIAASWNGHVIRGASIIAFVAAPTLLLAAYLLWSRLEASWYFAYHLALTLNRCDVALIVEADRRARLVHVGLLIGACSPAALGLILAFRVSQNNPIGAPASN